MSKNPSKKYVSMCPRCNSTDVVTDMSNPVLVTTGYISSAKRCNNCGHSATFFPEVEESKASTPKTLDKIDEPDLINNFYTIKRLVPFKLGGILGTFFILFVVLTEKVYFMLYASLPFAIAFLILGFKNDWMRKHVWVRRLIIFIFIFSVFIVPLYLALMNGRG